MVATADTFGLVGQIIDSQLRMEEAIGEGGFSLVYKATHLGLGEPVAVKCLKLPSGVDPKLVPSFTQRFREESRLCYRLSQGNLDIVRSMTSGSTVAPLTGELVPYMALEWLEGVSLVTDLQERRARGLRGRSVDEVVRMFTSAANAVAYAHSQGVIHRDLKPGNLFLATSAAATGGVRMKVLDFGLAKIMNDEAIGMTSNVKTMAPFFFCSPSYGAPEQFDPTLGELGPWTDVYALAMVLVEALCDAKARPVTNIAEALAAAMDPRNKPTPRAMGIDLGQEMERIFSRALSLQPKQRWPDAAVFWEEFRGAAAELPPMTARLPDAAAAQPPRPASRFMSPFGGTPKPSQSNPSYKFPAMEQLGSVAEVHVDAEMIMKSVPPPYSGASASELRSASSRPRRGLVVVGVLFALALVAAVVGVGMHFASGSEADAGRGASPTRDAAASPAAGGTTSATSSVSTARPGAPPLIQVEQDNTTSPRPSAVPASASAPAGAASH